MDLFPFFKTIIFLILICEVKNLPPWLNTYGPGHREPQYKDYFCNDSDALAVNLGLRGPYSVWIKDVLEDGTEITVKFNSMATVFVAREWEYKNMTNLKLKQEPDTINNIYKLEFTNKTKDLRELFRVKADEQPHHPPYIISFKINGVEKCHQPNLVFEVIVHDDFQHRSLNNDIALVKLLTAAQYNNYVQPACLWFDGIYDQIGTFELTGTVPGWGFDATDTLTKTLLTATMTIVPDVTCILFEPVFYQRVLNGKKFCAGHQNGTSPCNGDSGGGYVTFVYDKNSSPEPEQNAGAWYVKGIVSMTLSRSDASVCDPNGYTVFTDVAQYRDWILNYINRET